MGAATVGCIGLIAYITPKDGQVLTLDKRDLFETDSNTDPSYSCSCIIKIGGSACTKKESVCLRYFCTWIISSLRRSISRVSRILLSRSRKLCHRIKISDQS